MPEPRSNWTCLSKKCAGEEGQAPTFEASIRAKACPECGSKRIRRLYDAINVATRGIGKFVDPLIEPVFDRQGAVQDAASRHPAVVHGPASNMGALLAKATGMPAFATASAGPANKRATAPGIVGQPIPSGGSPLPAANLINRRPRPAPGSPSVSRQELGM